MTDIVPDMLLKVCVNGARRVAEHAALSNDPNEVAAECADAVRVGAGAVHIHPKDPGGGESLLAVDVDRWVSALRQQCPGIPVGVTTGEWALPDVAARLHAIDEWRELPDFASVNWHEEGADEVAARLLARGIGVEAGIWHDYGLRAWAVSPVRQRCLRVLVEVQDMMPHEARESGRSLVAGVQALEPDQAVLLHGEERSTWAAIELAGQLGLETRAGLEDCLTRPSGALAKGNADLVQAATEVYAKNGKRRSSTPSTS